MKKISFFNFLVVLICVFSQGCNICGRDDVATFHPDLSIQFNTESGVPQISPLGDFNLLTSALYNEEGVLIDTTFASLRIKDWNEDWRDRNVTYARRYKLHLNRNISDFEVIYWFDLEYIGMDNECDAYRIDELKLIFNDSVYYQGSFDANYIFTLK